MRFMQIVAYDWLEVTFVQGHLITHRFYVKLSEHAKSVPLPNVIEQHSW